jgi:hypothetical protein
MQTAYSSYSQFRFLSHRKHVHYFTNRNRLECFKGRIVFYGGRKKNNFVREVHRLWRSKRAVHIFTTKNSVAWLHERPSLVGEDSANFEDTGCHVVSVTDPCSRILNFLDWSRYFFLQVAPQLYSRGSVDPVSDPLPLGKSGSARNQSINLH